MKNEDNSRIVKFNEFVDEYREQDDLLLEMAAISADKDFDNPSNKVYVKGSPAAGRGRNEHGKPHVHFMYNNVTYRVAIPWTNSWTNKLITLDNDPSFNSNIEYVISKWFKAPSKRFVKLTNIQVARNMWDSLNDGNTNVKKFNPNV